MLITGETMHIQMQGYVGNLCASTSFCCEFKTVLKNKIRLKMQLKKCLQFNTRKQTP